MVSAPSVVRVVPENTSLEMPVVADRSPVTEVLAKPSVPPVPAVHNPEQGDKGFLYIRCEECGKEKGFCAKEPAKIQHCTCGHDTELKDLVVLWANCECGQKSKYLTNMGEYLFDMNCIKCGSPVPVKWNKQKRLYETVGN